MSHAIPPPPPTEPRIVAPRAIVMKVRPAARSNYSAAPRPVPTLIVLHCTDGHEGFRKDDDVAAMFARPDLRPSRSAHYVIDSDSATRCVPDRMTAWHCGRTGNRHGIGLEFCGRAAQTRAEWLDALSLPMLGIGARVTAVLCQTHGIPAVFVPAVVLAARPYNAHGITTHAEVAKAWGETRHTDPGPGFPLASFLAAVNVALLEGPPPRAA